MNIGNTVKKNLKSNFFKSVSNPIYDSILDYVTNDIWCNYNKKSHISSKIWNPVLIAVAQESINNSSNQLI
jgi:hypothetical protein